MGLTEAELRMLEMERTQIDGFDQLDREHKGYDTTLALMGVIRSLAETPGRKSIVFFSEGLPVSPVLSARFDDLIDAANRSNVTVYAVDANGLRTRSNSADTRKQIQEFTDDRMMQNISGGSGSDQPLSRGFETSRGHGQARLADGPGPARRRHRRVPRGAVQQPDAGLQAHRRGQPVPLPADATRHATRCSTASSARFVVKSRRSGAQVFARKGYRATRAPGLDRLAGLRVAGARDARPGAAAQCVPHAAPPGSASPTRSIRV